jgi:hypothetical protein
LVFKASKRAASEILEKGDVVELSKRPEKFAILRRLFTIVVADSRVQVIVNKKTIRMFLNIQNLMNFLSVILEGFAKVERFF